MRRDSTTTSMDRRRSIIPDTTEWSSKRDALRQLRQLGHIKKMFEDEELPLDLVKYICDVNVDTATKLEFLQILEEFGNQHISASRMDQVLNHLVGLFVDILKQDSNYSNINLLQQLLITSTTLLITSGHQNEELTARFVEAMLEEISTANDSYSRRLRGCMCQCLIQLEAHTPGLLLRQRHKVATLVKQERTDVCQDYILLLVQLLLSKVHEDRMAPGLGVQRMVSMDTQELLSTVSSVMETTATLTPPALWTVVRTFTAIIECSPDIPPSIFKPLILQHRATFDLCLLHMLLQLQLSYWQEILLETEDQELQHRLLVAACHQSLPPAHRLVCQHWLSAILQNGTDNTKDPAFLTLTHDSLIPSVFDNSELVVSKFSLLNHCLLDQDPQKLLGCLGNLLKLVEATGSERVATPLFRCLFTIQTLNSTPAVTAAILRITNNLMTQYPHLIPVVLDFVSCTKESTSDQSVNEEIIQALHRMVLTTPPAEVFAHHSYYMEILKTSSRERDICHAETISFLLRVVHCAVVRDACDWNLGSSLLAVCQSILLNQTGEDTYRDLGELLFVLMQSFHDIDIQDRSRFLYALYSMASSEKIHNILLDVIPTGPDTSKEITSLFSDTLDIAEKCKVVTVEEPVFTFSRMSVTPSVITKEKFEQEASKAKGPLDLYRSQLASLETSLNMEASFTMVPSGQLSEVFAVSVSMESVAGHYKVEDELMPKMTASEEKKLTFNVKPLSPLPDKLRPSAMFADVEGSTMVARLPEVGLGLEDLLLPMPWQELGVEKDRRPILTCQLWDHLNQPDANPREAIQSVKILGCPLPSLKQKWDAFLVESSPASKEGDIFAVFLPPKYHLMMKIRELEDHVVVTLATDFWQILKPLDEYLDRVDALLRQAA